VIIGASDGFCLARSQLLNAVQRTLLRPDSMPVILQAQRDSFDDVTLVMCSNLIVLHIRPPALSCKTAANVVCDVLAEHTGKLKTGSPIWTTVLTKHPCVAAAAGGQDAVNRRPG
jgi:hypothetical protein